MSLFFPQAVVVNGAVRANYQLAPVASPFSPLKTTLTGTRQASSTLLEVEPASALLTPETWVLFPTSTLCASYVDQ